MISLMGKVRELLAGVADGVFYFYPASWVSLPCVAWRESGNRALNQADGREHLAELTYSIDIWAKTPEENAVIAAEIDRRMAAARLRRAYSADIYEGSARLHHRALRYRAVADADGNIYQLGGKGMAVHAYGTVFRFTPAGGQQVTVGKLTSIGEISPDSEELDVTTLDSAEGYREYIQGYKDAGTIAIEGFFDKNDNGQAKLLAAYHEGTAGGCVIVFPCGATASFSAFVKGYTLGAAEVDGAVGFGAELRITGKVAYAAGGA